MSEIFTTVMGEDGSMVLPTACCNALGVKPGDTLVLESDGNSLLITPLSSFNAVHSELSES